MNRSFRSVVVGAASAALMLAGVVVVSPAASGDAFPGVNGLIVYASGNAPDARDIFTMKADGTGVLNLTNNGKMNDEPEWSADGKKIVFRALPASGKSTDIFSMSADGTGVVNLTNTPDIEESQPTWSPDGTRIAYVRLEGCCEQIYAMNSDGTGQAALTGVLVQDWNYEPAFSPDGTKIAFRKNDDTNDRIYVMDANGSNPVNLSGTGEGHDYSPNWAPDGTKIAFSRFIPVPTARPAASAVIWGLYQIYVMNANGTNQIDLTQNNGDNSAPAFSPDGTKITFVNNTLPIPALRANATNPPTSSEAIFTMNADGTAQTNLSNVTSNTLSNGHPNWQPAVVPPPTTTTTAAVNSTAVAATPVAGAAAYAG